MDVNQTTIVLLGSVLVTRVFTGWDLTETMSVATSERTLEQQPENEGQKECRHDGVFLSRRRERCVQGQEDMRCFSNRNSIQLNCCLNWICHHQKSPTLRKPSRWFEPFLHHWLTFLGSEASFSPSIIEFTAYLHSGDGGKRVFTTLKASHSACRELQELPDVPARSLFPLLCLPFHWFSGNETVLILLLKLGHRSSRRDWNEDQNRTNQRTLKTTDQVKITVTSRKRTCFLMLQELEASWRNEQLRANMAAICKPTLIPPLRWQQRE